MKYPKKPDPEYICALMEESGMNHFQLAELTGVDERTTRRWTKPKGKELTAKGKGMPFPAWKLFLLETGRIQLHGFNPSRKFQCKLEGQAETKTLTLTSFNMQAAAQKMARLHFDNDLNEIPEEDPHDAEDVLCVLVTNPDTQKRYSYSIKARVEVRYEALCEGEYDDDDEICRTGSALVSEL